MQIVYTVFNANTGEAVKCANAAAARKTARELGQDSYMKTWFLPNGIMSHFKHYTVKPLAPRLPDRLTLDEYTMLHAILTRVTLTRLDMDYADAQFWDVTEAMNGIKLALDAQNDVVYPDLYAKRKAEGVDVSAWKQP